MSVTILMPCLNEAETLALCINKAIVWIKSSDIEAEILIADNGSTDGSQKIACDLGAKVVDVKEKGYGSALYFGALRAKGDWIIMGDSDNSYDFSKLDPFIQKLNEGYDLVMGNRFLGGIEKGAMPWKNRYIGNPVLTFIGKFLFGISISDFHCGLRAFRKSAFLRMDLRTTGMEFASEMVIKSCIFGLKVAEVPTTLSQDGRSRPPHLRPWRDGWRHLRFMLIFSPNWLFLIPSLILLIGCSLLYFAIYLKPLQIFAITLDIHTLFYLQSGILIGLVGLMLSAVIKIIGIRDGLFPPNPYILFLRKNGVLEFGCFAGLLLTLGGIFIGVEFVSTWGRSGFGVVSDPYFLRLASLSTGMINIGSIIFLFSLVAGFLSIPVRR